MWCAPTQTSSWWATATTSAWSSAPAGPPCARYVKSTCACSRWTRAMCWCARARAWLTAPASWRAAWPTRRTVPWLLDALSGTPPIIAMLNPRANAIAALLLLLAAVLVLVGTSVGSTGFESVLRAADDPVALQIVWDIRLPRTLGSWVAGALLGLAGAVAQGLFRNPLADPY